MDRDHDFMRMALDEADKAQERGEVPAGAVVVGPDGRVIGRAGNGCLTLLDPTAHAEILALRQAALALRNYRLEGAEVFSTLEPCAMCLMAMVHARIRRLVFGAAEPKWGAAGSLLDLASMEGLNHRIEIKGGILAEAAGDLMRSFFKQRRGTEVAVTGATRNRLAR